MRNLWMKFPIRFSMVVLFLGISLLSMILLGVVSHVNYSKAVKKDFHKITDEAAKRLSHHIEFYFGQLTKTTRTLMNAELIQTWFQGTRQLNVFEQREIEEELRRHVAFNYTEVAGIFLRSMDDRVLSMFNYSSSQEPFSLQPWYAQPISTEMRLVPTHIVTYPQWSGLQVISLLNPVYSVTDLNLIGTIVFDLSLHEIEATFSRSALGDSGQFMMLSQDDTIVYHPVKKWRGSKRSDTPLGTLDLPAPGGVNVQVYDGKKMLISSSRDEIAGWKIIAVVPFDEMASGLYTARNATIFTYLIIAVVVILLVPLVSNLFVAPVLLLKQEMNRVAHGDYKTRAEVRGGRNEFQMLNLSFNRMVEQLDEQLQTISNLKLQDMHNRLRQREAYIQALQNQINPHLLYNSLDVIKSIGYIHDNDLVVSMAGNLADVYRYTAKITDMQVTLKEEIITLEKYLEITRIRFPKKFHSQITVSSKFLDCLVIKLTVQPIVENAVKYAVEPKEGDAAIIVSAYDDKRDLIIEIADNGEGIPEGKLLELKERLAEISQCDGEQQYTPSGSLGLTNVHTRLVLKYGKDYGLSLSSFQGRGTVVSIRIPMSYRD